MDILIAIVILIIVASLTKSLLVACIYIAAAAFVVWCIRKARGGR